MKDDLATTVAFSGHRTYCHDADAALRATVGELYARGFRTFLCGMAVGFDLAAAEAVLACRDAAGARSGYRVPASAAETVLSASFAAETVLSAALDARSSGASAADVPLSDVPEPGDVQACRDAAGAQTDCLVPATTATDPVLPAATHDLRSTPASAHEAALRATSPPADAPMPDLRLVAVVPFQGQESRFSTADRAIFHRVLAAADRVVVLAPAYRPGCYAVRNNYLIDHASLLVAWYDGSPGGTHYTVRRALARRLEFINLHRAAPPVPRPEPTLF